MTYITETCHHTKAPRRGFLHMMGNLIALRRERRALAKLSDEMLDDIGISRRDALCESKRSIWDAPDAWLR